MNTAFLYDELETYFIVNKVTQQLDEQEDGSVLDFQKLLEQDIRRARRNIHKRRGNTVCRRNPYSDSDRSAGCILYFHIF